MKQIKTNELVNLVLNLNGYEGMTRGQALNTIRSTVGQLTADDLFQHDGLRVSFGGEVELYHSADVLPYRPDALHVHPDFVLDLLAEKAKRVRDIVDDPIEYVNLGYAGEQLQYADESLASYFLQEAYGEDGEIDPEQWDYILAETHVSAEQMEELGYSRG